MPKFVFAYHGGSKPETPEEGERLMAAWKNWLNGMGSAVIDQGNPVGPSKTLSSNGVADNGGSNSLSGYSLIMADDIDAAVEMAKGCPILSDGSIEIAEAIDM